MQEARVPPITFGQILNEIKENHCLITTTDKELGPFDVLTNALDKTLHVF